VQELRPQPLAYIFELRAMDIRTAIGTNNVRALSCRATTPVFTRISKQHPTLADEGDQTRHRS
jgi:hypothetical protein